MQLELFITKKKTKTNKGNEKLFLSKKHEHIVKIIVKNYYYFCF
jgi:hypothetical protein